MFPSVRAIRVVAYALLISETAALVFVLNRDHPSAKTDLAIEPGKNYSLLVDSERFPINGKPGDKIVIEVEPAYGKPPQMESGRTRITETPQQQSMATPKESRFRFYYDDPRALAPFRTQEKLDRLRAPHDDWQTVLNVMNWSRRQFEPGTPKNYPPKNALTLLALMRSGKEKGFCAQYCYLMVQALQALNFKARYITIEGHEVAEAWVPSMNKWVLLDPMNNLHFEDSKGTKLSALEIARNLTEAHAVPASSSDLAYPTHYRFLAYWLRNDLYTTRLNIYDLNHYRVIAVLDAATAERISVGDLCTFYPDELYSPPCECRSRGSLARNVGRPSVGALTEKS